MSATDFRPGQINRKKSSRNSLVQHIKMDKRVSLIFLKKRKVVRTKDISFSNSVNPLVVNEKIADIEKGTGTKFRGWKTNFQPRSFGTRIFMVFS